MEDIRSNNLKTLVEGSSGQPMNGGTMKEKKKRPILSRLRSFSDPKTTKKEKSSSATTSNGVSEPSSPLKKGSSSRSLKFREEPMIEPIEEDEQLDEASTIRSKRNPNSDEVEEYNCNGDSDDEYEIVDEDGDCVGSPSKGKLKKNIYKWVSITFQGLSGFNVLTPDTSNSLSMSPRVTTQPSTLVSQRRRSTVEL